MRIDIFNTGSANVTIDSMIDDVFGDLDGQGTCRLPQIVPQNPDSGVYTCTYTARINGVGGTTRDNTVTASGTDSSGNLINSSDTSTVQILGVPGGARRAIPVPGLSTLSLLLAGLLLVAVGAWALVRRQTG